MPDIDPSCSRRARWVGCEDPALETLLQDLLADMGIALSATPGGDLVVAYGRDASLLRAVIAEAGGAPVIALVPVGDQRLVREARACGAAAVHTLDAPVAALRSILLALVSRGGAQ